MTAPLVQSIAVGSRYPVHFTRDVFHPDNPDLASALTFREPGRRHRAVAFVDRGVARAWPDLCASISVYSEHRAEHVQLLAEPMLAEGGEAAKNDPAALSEVLAALHRHGVDRQSFVIAVGGGAMLDMVGYAAATAHRGLRLVRVPTTTLAQADSAVGVKNGVNAFGKKNFLGTFAAPFAVLVDSDFLWTQDRRDLVAGLAEAVKVALLRDPAFFDWLSRHTGDLARGERGAIEHAVRRSAELHLAHVAGCGDPFETGSARPLDFGHWAAHKLETSSGHRLRHGEAVAIGMAIDILYSASVGICDAAVADGVLGVLRALGFRLWDEALALADGLGRPLVLAGLDEFREHLGGELTVPLIAGAGRSVEVHSMSERAIRAAIGRLGAAVAR